VWDCPQEGDPATGHELNVAYACLALLGLAGQGLSFFNKSC
jgi:hypothetical protein